MQGFDKEHEQENEMAPFPVGGPEASTKAVNTLTDLYGEQTGVLKDIRKGVTETNELVKETNRLVAANNEIATEILRQLERWHPKVVDSITEMYGLLEQIAIDTAKPEEE